MDHPAEAGPAPVVTSGDNATVRAARKLARPHVLSRGDAFLVEGPGPVREAAGRLRTLFATPAAMARERDTAERARAAGAEVVAVSERVLATLATTVTPQGLVGVATLRAVAVDEAVGAGTLVIVLAGVSDPGNAGAVVRSADAAGATAVVVTAGSVDVRNPKAVRASAGSLFHLPVVRDAVFADVAAACRARGLRLVAAAADGARTVVELDLRAPTAIVFGNEASGLDDGARRACDVSARVPMHAGGRAGFAGRAESLNLAAAAAMMLYEAARQRRRLGRMR
ncbi:MAG: RNA methyltransferase [Actinobacteria bacterium]|nr:RNA methyltransferase [Actinomycetota bacterium]